MKLFIQLIFISIFALSYRVSAQEVNLIIHEYNTLYVVNSINDIDYTVTKKYTILNAEKKDEIILRLFYDKTSKISNANITYKTPTKTISYKLKEFTDQAAFDGYSIFSDNRMKYIAPQLTEYPIYIDYSYSINYKNTTCLKPWLPITTYNTELEGGSLKIEGALEDLIKYKEINFEGQFVKNANQLSWTSGNIKPIRNEIFDPGLDELLPLVLIGTNAISWEKYKGDLSSWDTYGDWVNVLLKDRQQISEDQKQKLRQLINPIDSDKSKIEKIYKFLQSNNRYVSVTLGIGGLQPMSAEEVSRTGYGDCKALSNYMKAMLESIGISSYYTEIGNGSKKIKYQDFPSFFQTNHVILTVPIELDTMFLECTSQFFPAGYIGNSNSDRLALMVNENGGNIIKTPVYNQTSNFNNVFTQLDLESSGSAYIYSRELFSGLYFEQFADFSLKNVKEQKEIILNHHDNLLAALDSFDFRFEYSSIPTFLLDQYLNINKYASISGSRMFIPLHIIKRFNPAKTNDTPRDHPVQIESSLIEIDSLDINLPPDYTIESMPKAFELTNDFGSLKVTVQSKDQRILITNRFELLKHEAPKESFESLYALLSKTYAATQSKIVLKKNTP